MRSSRSAVRASRRGFAPNRALKLTDRPCHVAGKSQRRAKSARSLTLTLDQKGPTHLRLDRNVWKKWQSWSDRISLDITYTVTDSKMFKSFNALCEQNAGWIDENGGDFFYSAVHRWYGANALIAVRRQLKDDSRSVSLVRLLKQIGECSQQLTLYFYLRQFPRDPNYVDWQTPTFGILSADGKMVSPDIVKMDLSSLQSVASKIERIADTTVAHLDRRKSKERVTFNELAAAIDGFNLVACKYISFVTSRGSSTLDAEIMGPWDKVFLVPLVRPV
jgi:hypothetical protein